MATEREVRNGLRELPITLRNAYQQIYDRILAQQPGPRRIALNAFRWIKFSCEPVCSETLLDAASADISPAGEFSHEPIQQNVLLKACHNLVILDKSLNVFRFAHLSVEEFFDVTLSTEDSHSEIAQACLSLICTAKAWDDYDPNVVTREGWHQNRHLLLYSAVFWPWHFARADDSTILDIIWDAFVCETNHQRWWKYCLEKARAYSHIGSVHWQRVSALSKQNESLVSCVCVFDISRKFLQIMDSCAPPTIDLNALLSTACRFGDLEISRLLIDKGSDVTASDDDGRTPLHQAVMGGHEGVARRLNDKGSDVTASDVGGRTPLHQALEEGHEGVARLLIDKGADVTVADKLKWTPLDWASIAGNKGLAQLLIEKGADAAAADEDGSTALHLASGWGREEVVGLLIDKGADPSAGLIDGLTPLHRAVEEGHSGVVRLLVDKGADVTIADKKGRTPLHLASKSGNEELVRLLVDKGADVTIADKKGRIPLHLASKSGTEEVVRLLVDKGSDATAADNDGVTPLLLMDSRMPAIAAQLLSDNAGERQSSRD